MKNEQGLIQILLVIGIVAALGVIGYTIYSQKVNSLSQTGVYNPQTLPTSYKATSQESGQVIAPVNNNEDLNSVSANLDTTDITQIDSELGALDSASSGF